MINASILTVSNLRARASTLTVRDPTRTALGQAVVSTSSKSTGATYRCWLVTPQGLQRIDPPPSGSLGHAPCSPHLMSKRTRHWCIDICQKIIDRIAFGRITERRLLQGTAPPQSHQDGPGALVPQGLSPTPLRRSSCASVSPHELPDARHPNVWINELQMLSARFTGLGINPDLAALAVPEAWGLLHFLKRAALESSDA